MIFTKQFQMEEREEEERVRENNHLHLNNVHFEFSELLSGVVSKNNIPPSYYMWAHFNYVEESLLWIGNSKTSLNNRCSVSPIFLSTLTEPINEVNGDLSDTIAGRCSLWTNTILKWLVKYYLACHFHVGKRVSGDSMCLYFVLVWRANR